MADNTTGYRTRPVSLSGRLQAISALAGTGSVVCDVGCDHAHIPIRLLQEKRFSRAIGMDVIEGPLGKAAGNLRLYGMEDRVELRLSDGLDAFHAGEADTLIIAGMGGSMIRDILLREPDKTRSFRALVLGPQSDPDKVRRALRRLGFVIEDERLLFEDGKYYPVLRAVRDSGDRAAVPEGGTTQDSNASDICQNPRCSEELTAETEDAARQGNDESDVCSESFCREDEESEKEAAEEKEIEKEKDPEDLRRAAEDLFGPVLLDRRDPVLHEYLVRQRAVQEKILRSVRQAAQKAAPGGEGTRLRQTHLTRQREVERSLRIFCAALERYK